MWLHDEKGKIEVVIALEIVVVAFLLTACNAPPVITNVHPFTPLISHLSIIRLPVLALAGLIQALNVREDKLLIDDDDETTI